MTKIKASKMTLAQAKKNNLWSLIPIDKLPDDCPVIGVTHFPSKSFAEFHLIKVVLVPAIKVKKPTSIKNKHNGNK